MAPAWVFVEPHAGGQGRFRFLVGASTRWKWDMGGVRLRNAAPRRERGPAVNVAMATRHQRTVT